MSFKLYLSFLAASVVLIYAPGPVNLLTMNQALRTGWRRALPCVWGGTLAVLLQLALTALCLNSLVHLDEHALTVLRWAGAAYLVWLGGKQWLSRAPAGARLSHCLPPSQTRYAAPAQRSTVSACSSRWTSELRHSAVSASCSSTASVPPQTHGSARRQPVRSAWFIVSRLTGPGA